MADLAGGHSDRTGCAVWVLIRMWIYLFTLASPGVSATAPSIVTASRLPGAVAGTLYSLTLAATGSTPIAWSVTGGTVPAGLSLGASTGTIGGTPSVPGVFMLTVHATNASGRSSKQMELTVTAPPAAPTITVKPLLPSALIGAAYSQVLTASGAKPIAWSMTRGALPAGLALGTSTGIISGTPTVAGVFTPTVSASNAGGSTSEQLSLTVDSPGIFGVWVVSSLDRVGLTDPAGSLKSIDLKAGRNDYQSFQVAVQAPSSGLSSVALTVSSLSGPNGSQIAASNILLFREGYVFVDRSSPDPVGSTNHPGGPGWYPDALIPLHDAQGLSINSPSAVPGGTNQPFWVDVYVPSDASRGLYSGVVTVTSGTTQVQLPLTLNVWHFVLPQAPTLQSVFPVTHFLHNDAVDACLLQNKVMDMLIDPALTRTPPGRASVNITGLPFSSGATYGNCAMSPAPAVAAIAAQKSYFPSGLPAYVWTADEIGGCSGLNGAIQSWAQNIHNAGALSLITLAPNVSLFDDGLGAGHSDVDIWVVLPDEWDSSSAAISQAMAKGDRVWSYNALVQDPYSPKWEIDFDLINYRIQPGMISQSLGLTGLLYWRVDNWSALPWSQVNNEGVFDANNYPGEGMLTYPGDAVQYPGIVPSMRLKQIRDGINDYEYIAMLKRSGLSSFAMSIATSVGADWHHWTQNHLRLQQAHDALGTALDSVSQ